MGNGSEGFMFALLGLMLAFMVIVGIIFVVPELQEEPITYNPDDNEDVYDPKHAPVGNIEFITRSYQTIPEDKLEIWFSFGVEDPDLDIREIKVTYQIDGGIEQTITHIENIDSGDTTYDSWGMSTFAEAPYDSNYGTQEAENEFYMLIKLRMWDNAGNYVVEQLFVTPSSYGEP